MFSALLVAAAAVPASASLTDRQLLSTPPMGFNNWARFECALNETLFVNTANAMAKNGMLDAGYNRLNLDDCWPLHHRTEQGELQWDPKKFPKGLVWLGKYFKSKGFHFGIYSDAGPLTCGGYPGSYGHEETDFKTFSDWGIDYLKLDGCNVPVKDGQSSEEAYRAIYKHWHEIFDKAGKPLIFSESAPAYFAGKDNLTDWYTIMDWVPDYGELARHSYDVATHAASKNPWHSVMTNYDYQLRVSRVQEPGYFNDPDFLISDEPYLSMDERKSQFALWSVMSAPLIVSAYVPGLDAETVEYLTNRHFIAINQDPLGAPATPVARSDQWDVLTKPLADGGRAVAILNKGDSEATLEVPIERTGLRPWLKHIPVRVTDLWTGKSRTQHGLKVTLKSHATAAYKIEPEVGVPDSFAPTGLIFNVKSQNALTWEHGELKWAKPNGSTSQIWQVEANGANLRPLSNTFHCVTVNGNKPELELCLNRGPQFSYSTSGNLKTAHSHKCLTESDGGDVVLEDCGYLQNDQVFEIPAGWRH